MSARGRLLLIVLLFVALNATIGVQYFTLRGEIESLRSETAELRRQAGNNPVYKELLGFEGAYPEWVRSGLFVQTADMMGWERNGTNFKNISSEKGRGGRFLLYTVIRLKVFGSDYEPLRYQLYLAEINAPEHLWSGYKDFETFKQFNELVGLNTSLNVSSALEIQAYALNWWPVDEKEFNHLKLRFKVLPTRK